MSAMTDVWADELAAMSAAADRFLAGQPGDGRPERAAFGGLAADTGVSAWRGWWRWPGASGSAHEDVAARDYFSDDGITAAELELMRQSGAGFLDSQGIGGRDGCFWPSGQAHRIDPDAAVWGGLAG